MEALKYSYYPPEKTIPVISALLEDGANPYIINYNGLDSFQIASLNEQETGYLTFLTDHCVSEKFSINQDDNDSLAKVKF